jgi:arylsulfatase A-like enzyme
LPRHVVLITLDHLAASQIGAYGQYRVRTPAFDQLAARAAVFHQCFCHAVPEPGRPLADDWAADPCVAGALATLQLAGVTVDRRRQSLDQSPRNWVLEGVAAIRQQLTSLHPGLTWIQGVGIPDPWVPDHTGWEAEVARLLGTPWEELLADESEEMTPTLAVEELVHEGAFSRTRQLEAPDPVVERLSLSLYAASVEKLDDRVGRLIREFQRHAHEECLLIIAGLQGDHLPHQLPIERPVQLHTELVRVPLFVQAGVGHAGGSTVLELVQTPDIFHTICHWLGGVPWESPAHEGTVNLLSVIEKSHSGRTSVQVTSHTGETLVRTPDAQLVRVSMDPAAEDAEQVEWLTLKPEDAWDLLNVAGQHPDLVDQLRSLPVLSAQRRSDHRCQPEGSAPDGGRRGLD